MHGLFPARTQLLQGDSRLHRILRVRHRVHELHVCVVWMSVTEAGVVDPGEGQADGVGGRQACGVLRLTRLDVCAGVRVRALLTPLTFAVSSNVEGKNPVH